MTSNVLQNELDTMLIQMANQSNSQPSTDQTVIPQPVPVSVIDPAAAMTATPTPVNIEQTEVPQIDLDAIVDSWDTNPTETAATPAPVAVQSQVNPISELAKVFNVQKEDEILSIATAYKQKAELLDQIPQDLNKAMEIARNGGDYLEYLKVSVVDWAKEDPITLYENYVIDQYTDPKSKLVDSEKVDKLLDRIEDDEKELRGRELQRSYINFQAQRQASIENEAKAKKQGFEQNLRQAVDSIDNIAGFKLTDSHKSELFNYIMSGQDLQPQTLQTRVVEAGLKKYWGKMDNFRKDQIKNATTRQILASTTFPKLNTTSTPSNIDAKPEKYGIGDYIKELEYQRGFTKKPV